MHQLTVDSRPLTCAEYAQTIGEPCTCGRRRTSVYTLEFEPRAIMPGAVDRQLDYAKARAERMVPDGAITGSSLRGDTGVLSFRIPSDDTEAARIAAELTILGTGPSCGKPRFADARLYTGYGTHKRQIPII